MKLLQLIVLLLNNLTTTTFRSPQPDPKVPGSEHGLRRPHHPADVTIATQGSRQGHRHHWLATWKRQIPRGLRSWLPAAFLVCTTLKRRLLIIVHIVMFSRDKISGSGCLQAVHIFNTLLWCRIVLFIWPRPQCLSFVSSLIDREASSCFLVDDVQYSCHFRISFSGA